MERRTFLGAAGITAAAGMLTLRSKAAAAPLPSDAAAAPLPDPSLPGAVNLSTTTWVVGKQLTAAPALDGTFGSTVWTEAPRLGRFGLVHSPEPAAVDSDYRLAWHGNSLYLGGRVAADLAAGTARILVVIDPDPTDDVYAVIDIPINPVRTTASAALGLDWRPEHPWAPQAITVPAPHTLDPDTGDLLIELAVGFDQLGVTGPPSGEWGFTVIHLTEMGGPRVTAWAPIRTANYVEGAVSALGEPAGFEASVAAHSAVGYILFDATEEQTWQPATCILEWTGPTTKRLTVSLDDARGSLRRPAMAVHRSSTALEWVDPEGHRVPLEAEVVLTTDDLVATFDHPLAVVDGRYRIRIVILGPTHQRETHLSFDREDLVAAGLRVAGEAFPSAGTTVVQPAPASPAVQQLLALLPAQFGIPHVGHPAQPHIRPQFANWRLSEDLSHLIHIPTQQVFPSPDYPENHVDVATNALGEQIEYPYHEDQDGRRYFFTPALWNHQTRHVRAALPTLATSDPLGAARILQRFGEVARGYVPRSNAEWNTYVFDVQSGPAYNRRAGYWSVWTAEELNHFDEFLTAYERVASTNAFALLSEELNRDVEQDIRDGLFRPGVDYVLSCIRSMHNTDPYVWQRLVRLGRTLKMPDRIHLTLEWIDGFMRSQFLSDGFWMEAATAYHTQVINNVAKALTGLSGYSDPAGYVSPRSGVRIDDLDLSDRYPLLADQKAVGEVLTYPNRRQLPLQDTWAHVVRAADPQPGPFVRSRVGVARLEVGTGANRTQLYLMASPKYGNHGHRDPLNIALFAEGQELLPDIGYTYTKYRQFTASTIGHNTVLVDGADMTLNTRSRHGGSIDRFLEFNGAQFVSASYPSAHPTVSTYRRTVILRSLPDGSSCVVDLFRVVGGSRHEYVLHGEANRDAHFELSLELTPYGDHLLPPGVEVRPPVDDQDFGEAGGHYPGYQYVREVSSAPLPGGCQQLDLVTVDDAGEQSARLAILSASTGDDVVHLGRSPSLRMTRLYGNGVDHDNNEQADAYSLPVMVQRREGTGLTSTFVTALEPYRGEESTVELCVRLEVDSGPADAVAVRIVHGDVATVLVHNPSGAGEVVVGDLRLKGEYGEATFHDGALRALRLVGGSDIAVGASTLSGAGPWQGIVLSSLRKAEGAPANALISDVKLPGDLVGERITVTHPDATTSIFTMTGIADEGSGSMIDIGPAEPGFVFDSAGGSNETHYPARRWGDGEHSWVVVVAREAALDLPAPTLPSGRVAGIVVDGDDNPVEGAQVHVAGHPSRAAITVADGSFALTEVPIGTHHLVARRDGWFRAVPGPLAITTDAETTTTVLLTRRPARPELTEVTRYQVAGQVVGAVAPGAGALYLVPATTPRALADLETAVTAGDGVTQSVAQAGTATVATTALVAGQYRLYFAGDGMPLSQGYPVTVIPTDIDTLEDDSPLVTYQGTWTRLASNGHSGGSFRYAQNAGAAVEFGFYGDGATVKGHTNDAGGLGDVYVDGVLATTVDYYSAAIERQVELFDTGTLPEGVHVISIVTRGARGTGHPANVYAQVRFDAAVVRGA